MHRGATTLGHVVTSCGAATGPYPTRLEKVKFGVPLEQVCKGTQDLPGPLLVLVLKLNKEAPRKKDVFRAPGHQGNIKKLVHFLHQGRLVNMDNFSVYTIASVIKKFLRKIPGGVFGPVLEEQLFTAMEVQQLEERRERVQALLASLPVVAQRLLVLLFGTFRVIASSADLAQTGMTSEALGVSVAPSFFHSCVSSGKVARMEDVVRFKSATHITKFLIDNFGVSNLFGRDNYEYYARLTGRVLKVEEDWIFAFRYPPDSLVPRKTSLEAERSWLRAEAQRWGLVHQSTPALAELQYPLEGSLDARVSMSLEDHRPPNAPLPQARSMSFLPLVHERQTARMRTRSEWFLTPQSGPPLTPAPPTPTPGPSTSRAPKRRSTSRDKENGPPMVSEQDCTELDVRTFHVTLTYKPRI